MTAQFKDRLFEAMKEKGIKSADLCRATGFSSSLVSQYMTGKIEPRNDKAYILADYLGVSPAWLLGWIDDPEDYEEIANDEGWSIPSDFMPNADSYDRARAYYKFKKAEEEDQAAEFHKEAKADRRLLNAYHAADPKTQKVICIMLGIEE